ncbi:MAG: GNAT family N-acetyltransferase [Nocardioides sp.]
MELREVGLDDTASVETFVEIANSVTAADAPWEHPDTPYRRAMQIRHGWDGEPGRHFLALDGVAPVGVVVVHTSNYDNLDLAWLDLRIHPAHRRHGLGTAALEAAYDVCREMKRDLLGLDGWESDQTRAFAKATGFEQKSQSINRRQHLAEVPADGIAQLYAAADEVADDYELLRFDGRTPDDLMDDLARVAGAINDAPLDDLELEDEVYSPDRMRAYETAQIESGFRFRRVVARHRGTGELAGHTVVTVDTERPGIGDQHDTAVAREHRGHRLGVLVKADMVRWLAEEPQLATIDTWNAESNDHMIGVNELLGYRIMGRALEFQRRI